MAEYVLIPHPYNPPAEVSGVTVSLMRDSDMLVLDYRVEGGPLDLPPPVAPARTDELWKRTCFELFLRADGEDGYIEFNFSPSGAWAAYAFTRYRTGMRPLPLDKEPTVTRVRSSARVRCVLPSGMPASRMALTAVIQEVGGRCSFWSLAHPVGPPDFHHPDCFAARLTAAGTV